MTEHSPILNSSLLALCFMALCGWLAFCWMQRRVSVEPFAALLYLARLTAAWGFWVSGLVVFSGLVQTVGTWPFWFLGLSAAIASEAVFFFYQTTGSNHTSASVSAILSSAMPLLRVAMIGLLTVVLLEPIVSFHEEREEERFVAVLLDESDSMSLNSRSASDGGRTRREVAHQILSEDSGFRESLLQQLVNDYQVRLYRFGASASEIPLDSVDTLDRASGKTPSVQSSGGLRSTETGALSRESGGDNGNLWAQSTDMANALQRIDNDLPLDELSGIVLLSDGCDHSDSNLQKASRRLTARNIPINSVVIGSQSPVRDAEIVTVQAPHQIYHGDSVLLRATVKVDQFQGRSAKLRLLKDGEPIDEQTISITTDRHRQTVAFRHQPDVVGIHEYSVELEAFPDEENIGNNIAERPVCVSKDHIRMLIIDDRPRWEFRYLRNLFSGRDRTVFLQSVLLRPDRLAGVPNPPLMHASALRAFDDCEATALPENETEWLKFDVIVLGDVPRDRLGQQDLKTLETFVKNRGGTLIVISGQGYMPHAYAQTPLADLLPVRLDGAGGLNASSPDQSFYFAPTDEARSHAIVQQLGSSTEDRSKSFPELSWRHPASEAKVGANVLAYASTQMPDKHLRDARHDRTQQRHHALMLWHRFGAGKVLQLTFDQSWRLRYGVGDKYHHQFWGQIIRWAVKERLSAGTELVRMATDQVQYFAGETVTVRARLLDGNRNPITDQDVQAVVYLDDEIVHQITLTAHPGSAGLLHAHFSDLTKAGKYRVELAGNVVDRLLRLENRGGKKVATEFSLETISKNTEASDIVADATTVSQLADWTDGIVVTPENAYAVLEKLGPKSAFDRRRWTVPLWNLWPVIVSFLGSVSLEWVLRKSKGLL